MQTRRMAHPERSHATERPIASAEAWRSDPLGPIDNLKPRAAAAYLGLSESMLAKLRMADGRSRGPAFVKIGKAVIYRRVDLDTWLASHLVEAA